MYGYVVANLGCQCDCISNQLTPMQSSCGEGLAAGEGQQRIYVVEPTGEFEDDPNVTNKKFPGNPTKSYRTQSPLKIVGEVIGWNGHSPEVLQNMRENIERLSSMGIGAIE